MAEAYKEFDFEHKKWGSDIHLRLHVTDTLVLSERLTRVNIAVEGYFGDDESDATRTVTQKFHFKIVVDGSTKMDEARTVTVYARRFITQSKYGTLTTVTVDLPYNPNCNGCNISVTVNTDEYASLYYATRASASYSLALDELAAIDVSEPVIHECNVHCNRYGREAVLELDLSHQMYNSNVELVIDGTGINTDYYLNSNTAQNGVTVRSKKNGKKLIWSLDTAGTTFTGSVDLNPNIDSHITPTANMFFQSGASYPYTLTVTAENGMTATRTGVLSVPQRVTGISCEEALELDLNETVNVNAFVKPENAEEKRVIYYSSDENTATVNENGDIHAIAEGGCVITAESFDGSIEDETAGCNDNITGFGSHKAFCNVNITNGAAFPNLDSINRYLGVAELSRLNKAINDLSERLETSVQMIGITGRNHDIKQIKAIFESVDSCCDELSSRAMERGFIGNEERYNAQSITDNNNTAQWYDIVHRWIDFLKNLNERIT